MRYEPESIQHYDWMWTPQKGMSFNANQELCKYCGEYCDCDDMYELPNESVSCEYCWCENEEVQKLKEDSNG